MIDVTKEFHWVRPKRYLSLWYVKNNPCTYVTSTLTPFANGPNEIPQDPRHLGDPSGASKMISEPMVCLAQTVQLSYINTNTISKPNEWDSTRPSSPRRCIGCVQNDIWPMVRLAQTVHQSYVNTNTISKRTEWDSTWPTSPRSCIVCIQNDI